MHTFFNFRDMNGNNHKCGIPSNGLIVVILRCAVVFLDVLNLKLESLLQPFLNVGVGAKAFIE